MFDDFVLNRFSERDTMLYIAQLVRYANVIHVIMFSISVQVLLTCNFVYLVRWKCVISST